MPESDPIPPVIDWDQLNPAAKALIWALVVAVGVVIVAVGIGLAGMIVKGMLGL